MKYLAVVLAIALCMASGVAADGGFFVQFNSLQELHDDFTSTPALSAGYIQGVMDMESLEAMAANDGSENAWHACLVAHPELTTAPKVSVLVDEWYEAHPADRGSSTRLVVFLVPMMDWEYTWGNRALLNLSLFHPLRVAAVLEAVSPDRRLVR